MKLAAFRDRDFELSVYFQTAAGVAIPITGSTWTFKLYPNESTTAAAEDAPSVNGDGTAGRIDIAIAAADMGIAGGLYVGEILRTDTGADVWARFYVDVANVGQLHVGPGDITLRRTPDLVVRAVNAPVGPQGPAGSGGGGGGTGTGFFLQTAIGGTQNALQVTTDGMAALSATRQFVWILPGQNIAAGGATIRFDAGTILALLSPVGAALAADELQARPTLVAVTSTDARIYMPW
jgi:hypothetical protein